MKIPFRKALIISFFLGNIFCAYAQIVLSDQATVTMVTIGPYQPELWSSWGHSAIRIKDPENQIDWAYDFGRFSFDQDNFYWNYALGTTYYSIGKFQDYPRLRRYYVNQQRSVVEQVMNFSQKEVQMVFDLLEENNRPENREYLYNYVYDNCATRLVDIVNQATSDEVSYSDTFLKPGLTIRGLMDEGLVYQPWGDLLIDLLLGQQIDKEANFREYLMMPKYVEQAFDGATINRDSVEAPLVRQRVQVSQQGNVGTEKSVLVPFNVFVLLFFVVGFVTNKNFKSQKRSNWIDVILFSLAGLLGLLCTFLWFGTEHLSKYNHNLLWAIPFHLPAILFLRKKRFQPFLVRYFRFTAVLYVLVLLFWGFLPQELHQSLIPLILTLVLRSFYISYDVDRQLN